MKTRFTLLAMAVACTVAFTSCDPEELIKNLIEENSGKANFVVTQASADSQYYSVGDTVKLQTVICGSETSQKSLRMVGIHGSLISDNGLGDENFPVLAMKLMDSIPGRYQAILPTNDVDFVLSLNNWEDLFTSEDGACSQYNLMLIAVDADNYYLAYKANIWLDSVGGPGEQVSGRITDGMCKYINIEKMNHLRELKEAILNEDTDRDAAIAAARELESLDMDTYFPEVTLNGSFTALRADISRYMNAIGALAAE